METDLTAELEVELEKNIMNGLNSIGRTEEDHKLICDLIKMHEDTLGMLENAVSVAKTMLKAKNFDEFDNGFNCAASTFYDTVKEIFNFAENFKDY